MCIVQEADTAFAALHHDLKYCPGVGGVATPNCCDAAKLRRIRQNVAYGTIALKALDFFPEALAA